MFTPHEIYPDEFDEMEDGSLTTEASTIRLRPGEVPSQIMVKRPYPADGYLVFTTRATCGDYFTYSSLDGKKLFVYND